MHLENNRQFGMNLKLQEYQAICRSISDKSAGYFLHALPVDDRSEFSNSEFTTLMRMRFITPLHDGSLTGAYCCDIPQKKGSYNWMSKSGLHLLSCLRGTGKGNPTIHRHNCVRDKVIDMLSYAGCKEIRREPQVPSSDGLRVDLSVGDLMDDVMVMGDVTVAAPFRQMYCVQAARTTGYAAAQAASRKVTKYAKACAKVKTTFIPLAMETYGLMSPEFQRLITLAQRKVKNQNTPLAAFRAKNFARFWRVRLAVEFMKATAEAVLLKSEFICQKSLKKLPVQPSEMFCMDPWPSAQLVY